MLKLKLQYFGHLMWRSDSLEKTLMMGKIEGGRRERQRLRWLDGIIESMDWVWASSGSWWWTGKPGVLQSMVSQQVGHDWVTELIYRYYKTRRWEKQVMKLREGKRIWAQGWDQVPEWVLWGSEQMSEVTGTVCSELSYSQIKERETWLHGFMGGKTPSQFLSRRPTFPGIKI